MVTNKFGDFVPRLITACILVTFFLVFYIYAKISLSYSFIAILLTILLYEWPHLIKHQQYLWLITPFYPIAPFIFLILLNQSPERRLLIFMFTLSALFDSSGYFFGKLFGKHPLAPTISPYKTWEGLIAGFIMAWILGPVLMQALHMNNLGWLTLPFITICCILAFMGGVIISWFKRRAGVKDSSNLLPGHGGLLDRFDSVMLTSVFLYSIKTYLIS